MSGQRAEHREYEADYYADSQRRNEPASRHFGAEDQANVDAGAKARTQQDASQYSVSQGQQLLQGQTTRGDAPAPDQAYEQVPHKDLYDMVHNNVDLDGINDRGRVANEVGNWLADVSNQFSDAVNATSADWQGGAASQAQGFFQATADHAEKTGQAVQLVSNHYSQQAAAAHYAQTNMPEPTGFDRNAELNKAATQYASGDLGGMASTMMGISDKQQQADSAHAQAVQVMHGLDSTYYTTASSQPTYQPPPQPGQNESTSASGFHGGGIGGFSEYNAPGGSTGGTTLPPSAPTPGPGPTPPPPGTGGYVPPGTTSGTGGFTNTGTNFRTPLGSPTAFPRMTPDGLAVAGPAGGPGGSGGDITRSRPGVGQARSGFAGSRVSGGGSTQPKGEAEAGKGSGSKSAGQRIERGAMSASEAAAKTGKAGAGPGAAGAGKKKEEDKEHKNKLPNLEDAEETFAVHTEYGPDGEKVIPPVIGG